MRMPSLVVPYSSKCTQHIETRKDASKQPAISPREQRQEDEGSTRSGANAQTNKEGRPTFRPPKAGSTEAVALITPARRETNYSWRMLPRGRRDHSSLAGLFPLALGEQKET